LEALIASTRDELDEAKQTHLALEVMLQEMGFR
jgi:hypothetical protein